MRQSPPIAFVNLVGMAGDLNYLVPWLSGFLQFCDNRLSGGMIRFPSTFRAFARFLIMLPSLCSTSTSRTKLRFLDAVLWPSTMAQRFAFLTGAS